MKNPAMLAASLLLVGFGATACGGSSAPTDASKDEFCKAQSSLFSDFDMSDPAKIPSEDEMADAAHEWADKMEEVGTPEDISDEARDGFEHLVKQAKDADADDFKNLEENLEDEVSEDEKKADEAFTEYSTKTCGEMELGAN